MKNLLNEEIKKFKLLSNYDSRLTLTENSSLISELSITPGTTAKEIEAAISGSKDIRTILRDYKISNMRFDTVIKLIEKDAQAFEKELQKAFAKDIKDGFPKGTLGPMGKNLSKIDLLRRTSSKSKSLGRPLTPNEVDDIVKEVAAENKLLAAKFEPKIRKQKPPTPEEQKAIDDAIRSHPEKTKWPWKSILQWGGGILALAVLYGIYRAGHGGEDPPIEDDDIVVDDDDIIPTPDPSKYTNCPETFPIKQFCKNETIRKVQGCLGGGLKTDSAFGPLTQAALEAKDLPGTEITQDTVDKVCGGGSTTNKSDGYFVNPGGDSGSAGSNKDMS